MEVTFSINDSVKVKLTKAGLDELEQRHKQLHHQVPSVGDFIPPEVDEDGYSKFQLWDLMNTLGHTCRLGGKLGFETTIKLTN